MTEERHLCYILANKTNSATYNGYTTCLERRLRQHNGEICGGAKYTARQCEKYGVQWYALCAVTSNHPDFTKKKALSLEWHIRYPTGHRPRPKSFNGSEGRLRGLQLALQHPKFNHMDFTYVVPPPGINLENNTP